MSELHQMSVHALTEKLEKAEKELAVAVIENADLRERLSSLESLYRVRDKDCTAKEEELDELREALVAIRARIRGEYDHPALVKHGPLGELRDDVERIIDSALASPAAMDQTQPAPVTQSEKQCLCTFSQRMLGDGCYVCNPELAAELEAEAQLDNEDQLKEGE